MSVQISEAMAGASGLAPEDAETVRRLVGLWAEHVEKNRLRDDYYLCHVKVNDLGVSVSPKLKGRLNPRCDWAAKAVDWWADRVRFEGVTCGDEDEGAALERLIAENDARNLVRMATSAALRHSFSLLEVTSGDPGQGEPDVAISGYPATAASAVWDDAKKRLSSALVIVATRRERGSATRRPTLAHVMTDDALIVLAEGPSRRWEAEYRPHGMGRAPVVPLVYHPTLARPLGRSRITAKVRSCVDDALRELANMAVAAAFSAAPQKYLLGADKTTIDKLAETPFAAYIGSMFMATQGRSGNTPQYGQLSQMSMEPHAQYMRILAADFAGATGVPLSSMGVVTDNPSSADAIRAAKEDAIVDIQAYVDGCKRSLVQVFRMALAAISGRSYAEQLRDGGSVSVEFANPAMPSIVSQSDAVTKQVQSFPWMADSDVPLRELGYSDEQVTQLRSDRIRYESRSLVEQAEVAARQDVPLTGGNGGAGD